MEAENGNKKRPKRWRSKQQCEGLADLRKFKMDLSPFSLLIPFLEPKNNVFGLMKTNGDVVVEPKFSYASASSEGVAVASTSNTSLVLVNTQTLEEVSLPGIDCFTKFSNGLLLIEKEDRYGYVDKAGNIAIKPNFSWSTPMDCSGAVVKVKPTDKVQRRIDLRGKIVGEPFFQILQFHQNGVMSGGTIDWEGNEKMVIVNEKGEQVSERKFKAVHQENEGLIPVVFSDQSVGWVNRKGEDVYKLNASDIGYHFESRSVPVKNEHSKWGLMNVDGQWVVEPEFEIAESVGENRFRLGQVDKEGIRRVRLADECGHFFGDHEFDDIFRFKEGVALVTRRFSDQNNEEYDGQREKNYIDSHGTLLLDHWIS